MLFKGNSPAERAFTHAKQVPSPYTNRFLSADTIVPNVANPQDLNRYSYVRNNPVRYIDPTGYVCSDPDDPTPSCDGSGGRPIKTPAPLPPAPVIIRNPDPLDGGLQQDDPTPTQPTQAMPIPGGDGGLIPDAGLPVTNDPVVIVNPDPLELGLDQQQPGNMALLQEEQETNCLSCIIKGGAILVAVLLIEIPIIFAGVSAVILTGGAVIEPLLAVGLPIEAALLNISLIGFQYIKQGENRSREDIDIDYLPIVNIITDPNWEEGYLK